METEIRKIFLLALLTFPLMVGCLGGGNEANKRDTSDLPEVTTPLPDSILVRDQNIKDIETRKFGPDTLRCTMLIDDGTDKPKLQEGWVVGDSVFLTYEKTKRIDFNKVLTHKVHK